MVLTPRTGPWAATDFLSLSSGHPWLHDHDPLPLSPIFRLPITHAQLVLPASARMGACPSSGHTGGSGE